MKNTYKIILMTLLILLIIGCSSQQSSGESSTVEVGKTVSSDVIYDLDDFTGSPVKFLSLIHI